jgi:N-acetylglucosaminyl-diphospho-decaprenol L-rhamnosyltransferase
MKLEVLIVLYNNETTIAETVRSLKLIGDDIGVAFHDNSPGGASLQIALDAARAVGIPGRGEPCPTNCGFGRGCNRLAESSAAGWLLFLNPDATIATWPRHLPPDADLVVGAHVVDRAGRPAISAGRRPVLLAEAGRRLPVVGRALLGTWLTNSNGRAQTVDYVSGVALLLRRDLFHAVGGFDEQFFMYYEDVDLCLRAKVAGAVVTTDPDWVVQHRGGHSSRDQPVEVLIRTYDAGERFFAKHGGLGLFDVLCRIDINTRRAASILRASKRAGGSRRDMAALAGHIRRARLARQWR